MADFFSYFCSALGDGECIKLAEKVRKGKMTKEQFYEEIAKKFDADKIAYATAYARSKTLEDGIKTEVKKAETTATPTTPTTTQTTQTAPRQKRVVKVEVQDEKREQKANLTAQTTKTEVKSETKSKESGEDEGATCPVCHHTPEELEEAKKRPKQNYKTSLKDICRGCVAAYVLATLTVLKDWYPSKSEERKKLDELSDKVVKGEINVEDALFEMLKLKEAWDAFDRILKDFNQAVEYALNRAANEIPEIKQKIEEAQAMATVEQG